MSHRDDDLPAEIKLGFIGAGRMAQALVSGINCSTDLCRWQVCFVDPDDKAAADFQQRHSPAIRCHDLANVVRQSNLLLLAIKPQSMPQVLSEMATLITHEHLVVSVAAGVPIRRFQEALSTNRIIRVMPNTPCLILCGMSAMSFEPHVAESDRSTVSRILESVGEVVEVPESDLDAVTALSGSGPAYVFSFIESLIDAGIEQGLSPLVARELTLQTITGAVALVDATKSSPAELREQVTSPGGTTLAGLEVLKREGFAEMVKAAIAAAAKRSRELSRS